ncbi:MAG TPA: isoprenylcysteine carboxylmethyltransferase family protein [Devosia sp.]|nr:isoprenylcysteine carboxylmethyltransferase family protein [Devosia sp.]
MPIPLDSDHPDVIMLPPLILLIALVVAVVLEFTNILHFLPPISEMGWALYAGLALLVVALALGVSALRTFTKLGTNPSPHQPSLKLATTGPYRFTRNPMYLGFGLILAGLSLIFSLDWGVILVPVLALLLHYGVVIREEAYLTAKFGQPYRDFLGRTRRWL